MESDNTWGIVAGVIIGVLLATLLVQFAWNVGLVGALAAAGIAQIGGISYWTALGVLALSVFVRGFLHPFGGKKAGTIVQILKTGDQDD